MSSPVLALGFVLGTAFSLTVSWVLVTRIERVGARLDASEALLGLVAALAADTPEIASAVTALAHGQQSVGAGVVFGSNVFNLAALLGLGAVVAGGIALHSRVVVLAGGIAVWVALVCVLTIMNVVGPVTGLVLVLVVLAPYVVLAARGEAAPGLGRLPARLAAWLTRALSDEETELAEAVHPARGGASDAVVAAAALVAVVAVSVTLERAASELGGRLGVPGIVTGGLVLAGTTSLPNAVAAVYLARRGRGAATLSTALNSNALNVAVGFLIPGAVLGVARSSSHQVLVGAWYLALTGVVVLFAWVDSGVAADVGWLVLGAYAAFTGVVVGSALRGHVGVVTAVAPAGAGTAASAALLLRRARPRDRISRRPGGGPPAPPPRTG
jgi:cation:H+ antiporter